MHTRRVLVKPGCELVLRFFDRNAVDVVDLLPDRVIAPAHRTPRECGVIGLDVDGWTCVAERTRLYRFGQVGHMVAPRWRRFVALVHHHPPHVFQHLGAVLIGAGRAHRDYAGLAAGTLPAPEHLGGSATGV